MNTRCGPSLPAIALQNADSPERRHGAGLRASNGLSRQHAGAPFAALAIFLVIGCSAFAADPPITVNSDVAQGSLQVRYKGRKLLVYAFATNQFKPYVRELYTLRGENVTRDAPPDHPHHHGIMYAVWVNGINFWEEKGAAGVEKHIEMPLQYALVDTNGVPTAHFMEVIHWLTPTKAVAADSREDALLREQRSLTLTVDETNQEVALRWESQFEVGPFAGKVTISGPNYDGLGVRLPESFNHDATFHNSATLPYPGPNTQNVIPARWTSAAGLMSGHPVMLVMFGEARYFTMLDPFAYLSATQGLDQKPLEYAEGAKFSLSYMMTVYSEHKPTPFITRRAEAWEKERK